MIGDLITIGLAIAIPVTCNLAKRYITGAEESHFSRSQSAGLASRSGKSWKSHNQLKQVWPLVYALLGAASWLIWRQGGLYLQRGPLGRYACLLAANVLCWPPVFYGGHSKLWAFLDAAVLLLAALMAVPRFYEVDAKAGLLLLPYIGWTCFSSTLINCSLQKRGKQGGGQVSDAAAVKQGQKAEKTELYYKGNRLPPLSEPRKRALQSNAGKPSGSQSILNIDPPKTYTRDAATSPFQQPSQDSQPLAQAQDLLSKMAAAISSGSASEEGEAQNNEYFKSSLLRVNSLLNKVSGSIQGAAEAFTDSKAPGPLQRMGSLFSRVSMSLQRSQSGQEREDESLRWPLSDSIPVHFFSCPGADDYKVRGPTYLTDRKKFGPDSCEAKLVSLNLVSLKEPTFHISRFLPSIRDSKAPFIFVWQVMVPGKTHLSLTVAWALDHDPVAAVKQASAQDAIPEDEAMDLHEGNMVSTPVSTSGPSTPRAHGSPPDTVGKTSPSLDVEHSSQSTSALSMKKQKERERHRRSASTVAAIDVTGAGNTSPNVSQASLMEHVLPSTVPAPKGATPFDIAMARFLDEAGSDGEVVARRHNMFKIIPRVKEGGWIVKQAVGQNTPVLLGKKLTTKYFRGPRYLEVDVDVGSSQTAARVVGIVQGALKGLVIDIAVLLEGKTKEELPESLLGTVRLEHLDLSQAAKLDTSTGNIERHA